MCNYRYMANLLGQLLIAATLLSGPGACAEPADPLMPNVNSRMVFVAPSGNNTNAGLTADGPVKTLDKAVSLLRPDQPDWLLLQRSATYELSPELLSQIRRTNHGQQVVITAWGKGIAPRLSVPGRLLHQLEEAIENNEIALTDIDLAPRAIRSTLGDPVVYGAQPDGIGPIGGGVGYKDRVELQDATVVRDQRTLVRELSNAQPGQVIYIPGEITIDLTASIEANKKLVLYIPTGVTLAGDRGIDGSRGALIRCDAIEPYSLIVARGAGVRISGLRIEGPNPDRNTEHHQRTAGRKSLGPTYYKLFPVQSGVYTEHDRLRVDNCEISGFGLSGVHLKSGTGHRVDHNSIHHCQHEGLGYGVMLDVAEAVIEHNLFDYTRHAIAGTGRVGCSYVARDNIVGKHATSHSFDMHGGKDRLDGTDIAGTSIQVYSNTFLSDKSAVVVRGVPEVKSKVSRNWFAGRQSGRQALRIEEGAELHDNWYGAVDDPQ